MIPLTKNEFLEYARSVAATVSRPIKPNFASFLSFAYEFPIVINTFDGISLVGATSRQEVQRFLKSYVLENLRARDERVVMKGVATVPDPVVDVVLEVFGQHPVHLLGKARDYHRLSMAAENNVGALLEHYLAAQLEPQGWFWCACHVIKGVDFFLPGNPVTLLQVKNRSNSENSSSSAIRKTLLDRGCPVEIKKWYRINADNGRTYWERFPGNEKLRYASEDGFHQFIRAYLKAR